MTAWIHFALSCDTTHALHLQAVACLGGAIGFGTCCVLLQSLSLADCKRMSDVSLVALARGCKRLRFLNLSGCDKVSFLLVVSRES